MTSTSARLVEAIQSPPVFSYAQAAKGRNSSTATSAQQTNQTSGVSTPQKDSVSVTDVSVAGSEKGTGSVNGSNDVASVAETTGDASNSEQKEVAPVKDAPIAASPSVGNASMSTLPKEEKDGDFVLVGNHDLPKEKHNHASNNTERADEREGKRGKNKKKQKSAEKETEKEKEEVKPVILVAAPIPVVNIWQQRKTEAAKSKPVETSVPLASGKSQDFSNNLSGNKVGLHNGVSKEFGKGQKRGTEPLDRSKDDTSRRAAPRGSRSIDAAFSNQLPLSVADSNSWPTPETVLEDDKRKAQEKIEKDEKEDLSANKPRPKKEWVTVPYVPTVEFKTQLPTRGARGRGGARGGRTDMGGRSVGINGEKTATSAVNGSAVEGENVLNGDVDSKAGSAPGSTIKPVNEQGSSRRKSTTTMTERSRNDLSKNGSHASTDIRLQHQDFAAGQDDRVNGELTSKNESMPVNGVDASAAPFRSTRHQSEPNVKALEAGRERGEGRPERGRGGFRGRGGHNNGFSTNPHSQHNFANGQQQMTNGYPPRQNSAPYSPPLQQPFSNQFPPVSTRNGRGSNAARAHSIPNNNTMYRQYGPSQHMPSMPNGSQMYDHSMQSLAAGPYNYQIENGQILTMVTIQLDYYFSIDNLCKDVFLRKHMDSKGFVFLSFIAGFKRIQSLSQDYELLKAACMSSTVIESVKGEDGHERLRRKDGWEKWVLQSMEDRDESARHAGPLQFIPLAQAQLHQQRLHQQQMMVNNHYAMAHHQPFLPNGGEPAFKPYTNGVGEPQVSGTNGFHHDTPLSAAVADFAPGVLQSNGHRDPLDAEVTFADEKIAELKVFTKPPVVDETKTKSLHHNFATRTFSNGSIDETLLSQELHGDDRPEKSLNGDAQTSEE